MKNEVLSDFSNIRPLLTLLLPREAQLSFYNRPCEKCVTIHLKKRDCHRDRPTDNPSDAKGADVMKLPNGYGSVTKLSGKRRKPFIARITTGWEYNEEADTFKQLRPSIGTFAKREEALHALDEYHQDPYDIKKWCTTVEQLYCMWTQKYFETLKSDSSSRTIMAAWKYCKPLYNIRVRDLRAYHIKDLMDTAYVIKDRGKDKGEKIMASPGTKTRIKSLFNLMLDYALEYEVVKTNYARTFDISDDIIEEKESQTRSHIIFKPDEREILWSNVNTVKFVDWIIIQMYMGWRPQELVKIRLSEVNLDNWYIQSGMKTPAGKKRIVPIHSRIKELVQKNYNDAVDLGSEFLFNDPTSRNGMKMTYDKYAYRFNAVILEHFKMNPDHRPHDPRNTFITMAKRAGVDKYAVKRMVGHKIQDVTEGTYTDRDIEWMREDLEKIP